MNNPKKEKIIGIRVDIETKKALEQLAKAERRKLSDFIRVELEKLVESKTEQPGKS